MSCLLPPSTPVALRAGAPLRHAALRTSMRRTSSGVQCRTEPPRGAAPDAASHPVTAAIVLRVVRELSRMAQQLGRPFISAPFNEILEQAYALLGRIADHLHDGRIAVPSPVRIGSSASCLPPVGGVARIGVFPVNGNPIHWGHLLCALEAIAELELDQVVLLVQGSDARKPQAKRTQDDRHALARQVVTLLEPLVAYSDVGLGNTFVGEENLFRLLRLNPQTAIVAHYLVGGDHYRVTDQAGRPDTLARLEANMVDPAFEFDPTMHEVRAAFVDRGQRGPKIPTKLAVQFIAETLKSSSTDVRSGDLALTPHLVLRYLRDHTDYAKAIGFRGGGRDHVAVVA